MTTTRMSQAAMNTAPISANSTMAKRPETWLATASPLPMKTPGSRWVSDQTKADSTLMVRNRVLLMPNMPAMPGMTAFTPGTKRPMAIDLPP